MGWLVSSHIQLVQPRLPLRTSAALNTAVSNVGKGELSLLRVGIKLNKFNHEFKKQTH